MPCTGLITTGQAKDVAWQSPSMMASRMTPDHVSGIRVGGVRAVDNEGIGCGGVDRGGGSSGSLILKSSNLLKSS